jgi:hypothetical protein
MTGRLMYADVEVPLGRAEGPRPNAHREMPTAGE